MPTITARLKSVESKLIRGRDAQLWELRRSHMAADLDALRDMFAGRTTFAEYLEWLGANPGTDAGRPLSPMQRAEREASYSEFKEKLLLTVERIRALESAEFFETRAESATASTATVNQKCPLCRTHLRPPSPCSW
jgi:hypothetical protein